MVSDSEDEEEVVQPGKHFFMGLNDLPVSKLELTIVLYLLMATVKRNRTFFQDSEDEEEVLSLGKLMTRILLKCKEKHQQTSFLNLQANYFEFKFTYIRTGWDRVIRFYPVSKQQEHDNFHNKTPFCLLLEGQRGERHSGNNKQ